ncbi:MAG: aspartate/glutamate racemase family protein [Propionibacteriaceae bacterium]|nr:aspartate/glutamate racemase family protein [Propionibacteriaceae bacterium]
MKVFLLHTVRPGLNLFEAEVNRRFPGHTIYNVLDDYWTKELIANSGEFSAACRLHLLEVCTSMQQAGADLIVCTCSSLTPYMPQIRPFLQIPVVQIDDRLASAVLQKGSKVLLIASAESAIVAAKGMIEAEAARVGASCEIHVLCRDDAGQIMRSGGDMAEHDRIFIEAITGEKDKGFDVFVMCQLSTAHLRQAVLEIVGANVITTPELCLTDLENYIR